MRVEPIKDPQLKESYLNALFERDEGHPMNLGFDAIEDFKGYRPERSCTDKKCISVFAVVVGVLIFINLTVVRRIEYYRLLYHQDFRCDFCGIRELGNETYVFWPDPVNWGVNVKTCVKSCPNST